MLFAPGSKGIGIKNLKELSNHWTKNKNRQCHPWQHWRFL